MAAEKIWVYALADGVTGLEDFQGNPEKNVECGKLYVALSTHADIGTDLTKKLYHSADGIINVDLLNTFDCANPPVPPIPNDTTFVSATTTSNTYEILITLSDTKGYESVTAEWGVKINGKAATVAGCSGHGTKTFRLDLTGTPLMAKGDTVLVSHLVAASGIKKFTDKPVTNIVQ